MGVYDAGMLEVSLCLHEVYSVWQQQTVSTASVYQRISMALIPCI